MRSVVASSSRLLLLSSLVLTGCAGNPLQSATAVDGQASLSGELSTRSKVNANNGSRYQSFTLRLGAGEAVDVREEESLGTVLTLFDAEGRLVSGPGLGALVLAPTREGTYTLSVSGEQASTYGPFRLALGQLAVRNGGALTAGDSFVGQLAHNGNDYQLTVAQSGIYNLSMESTDFDTRLALQGAGIALENDDFGEGTNSRIQAFLQPGQYSVSATAIEDAARGTFSLSLTQRELPSHLQVRNDGALQEGQTLAGVASMTPVQYQFELEHTALVQLEMRSAEVDSLLELSGNALNVRDDDSGNNHDARLAQVLQPGRYQVSAHSVNGQAGLFELSYSQTPLQQGVLAQLAAGQFAQGRLSAERASSATVRIRSAGVYVIDLTSSDFDALLELQGGGLELQDDDSAGGTNARISQYLEEGDYQLKVGAVGGGSGRFVLAVRSED